MDVDIYDNRHQQCHERIEILGEILNIIARTPSSDDDNGSINRTKLMYKSRLPYAELREYLSVLIRNGLVDCIYNNKSNKDDVSNYRITERGMDFLILYKRLDRCISD
jgi:predicted transcriptional regulator